MLQPQKLTGKQLVQRTIIESQNMNFSDLIETPREEKTSNFRLSKQDFASQQSQSGDLVSFKAALGRAKLKH